MERKAIAVTDGSFKEGIGTAAWAIETNSFSCRMYERVTC
jgi:hypothetical protein